MEAPSASPDSSPAHPYALPIMERAGVPHGDAGGVTEDLIRDVTAEFYRRARRDDRLGPIFERHVDDWDLHLSRLNDFWSAALLRTGRYSGRPIELHRAIEGLGEGHFGRWIELFEATVRDLCAPSQAEAFLGRARKMREAMTRALALAV